MECFSGVACSTSRGARCPSACAAFPTPHNGVIGRRVLRRWERLQRRQHGLVAASSSSRPQPANSQLGQRPRTLLSECSDSQVEIIGCGGGGLVNGSGGRGPERLRVAVDVDEVLGRFVHTLNAFCKEKYGMEHSVSDYWVYEFAKIWHCDTDRSNHIVHDFFKSEHFNDGIPIIPGAAEALNRLQASADLVVVTSRQHVIQKVTLEWLERHFPSTFADVYFGNHFALEGVSRKKSDICRSIGAHVLIDDNPSYAMDCAAAGIHVLLFDWDMSYPWAKLPEGLQDPLIQVVRNWDEVETALAALPAKMAASAGSGASSLI